MNSITPLLDWQPKARARHADPISSREAAESLSSTHLEELERRIVGYLREQGEWGGTVPELADALAMPRDSISPRMQPIARKGIIIPTRTRRKEEGKRIGCTVWVAVSNALKVAA